MLSLTVCLTRLAGGPDLSGKSRLSENKKGFTGKSLYLFLIAIPLLQFEINAQTYTGNLTLTSQAEVDAFNYTSVRGFLIIDDADSGNITNLDGLSKLTSVGAFLQIEHNDALTNIDGLSRLTSVGTVENSTDRFLSILSCNALTNVDGLSGLTSVESNLNIIGCGALTNVDGLFSLTSVEGDLRIYGNPTLTNFCGLYTLLNNNGLVGNYIVAGPTEQQIIKGDCVFTGYIGNLTLTSQAEVDAFNYTSVRGFLIINDAVAGNITNLDGLSELTSVGAFLQIEQNDALTNIDGLSGLTSVGFVENAIDSFLAIINCDALTNVDGLSGLTSVGGYLTIIGCDELTNVDGLSGLTSVANLNISNNTTLTGFRGLYTLLNNGLTGRYNVSDNAVNPSQQQIIFGGPYPSVPYYGGLILTSQAEVDTFNYTTVTEYLIIRETIHGNITSLNGLSELTSAGGLNIYLNSALTYLDGLSNLQNVRDDLRISNNDTLMNINALKNVKYVGGRVIINDNGITNLDGLSNLRTAGGDLYVQLNKDLISFCGLYTLLNEGGLSGNYNVSDNGVNPTQQEIIDDGPCPPPNQPPLAVCRDVTVIADSNGQAEVTPEQVNNGSSDPDNDSITISLDPPGPYPLGIIPVVLTVSDGQASNSCNAVITVNEDVILAIKDEEDIAVYKLNNYPNPFNSGTVISWQLPVSGNVSLNIYDILGNEVAALVNENIEAGYYETAFDGSSLVSGMYICRLQAGDFVQTRKMLLLK